MKRIGRTRAERILLALYLAALALLPGLGGHAGVQDPVAVLLAANVLHVLGAGAWIGGIAALVLALPAATRAATAEARTPLLAATMGRFSTLAPAAAAPSPGAGVRPWVRLFVSAGQRDNVRPGDLVGAITGEAGITGEEVGRIEIRDTFSIVEVAADAAATATIAGNPEHPDYDTQTNEGPDCTAARGLFV